MKTYTIAVTPEGMLAACADQHYGIARAVRDAEEAAAVKFEGLTYIDGLKLTDDPLPSDEVVFTSGLGWLKDADETQYTYAVRRATEG